MPSGSKGEKERKRKIVARGVVAGKKTKAIAREAGASERHVERLVNEPETRLLITRIMRPHHARLEKLAVKAIAAVEGALTAKLAKGTPDHEIRLRAVGRYAELVHLAQGDGPAPQIDPAGGVWTWEQFVVVHRLWKEKQEAA